MRFLPFTAAALACCTTLLPLHAEEVRGDQPDAKPLTPQEQLKRFKVPPGFEVQLVASEPEIQKPMNLNFDAAGRLWTTGSEMYPWPAAMDANGVPVPGFEKVYKEMANAFGSANSAPEPEMRGSDTVKILSGFGADGRAGKIETFATGLNIPVGVQPLPRSPGAKGDSAIVSSIPNIWRFDDTDGDGKADQREVLYSGFGFLDTHGMSSNYIQWMDGWIYGCHGFRNHSEVRDKNGKVTIFDSGNTYRFKADGSAIEYWSHGQTNPFGLAFDPLGNLYSADSHSKPVYLLLRGAYYEGIGKEHEGLGFAPRITDDDHGSSAIAGVTYYAAEQYPEEYRGNLFNGNPVTRRINRARLEWTGSTPKAVRVDDFLSCDDPWFRPVQVKLGPDGALYIADFYNPIIGHYEVPLSDPKRDRKHGRIWRVVYKGAAQTAPDLTKLEVPKLVEMMGHKNLEVRRLAVNELVDGRDRGVVLPALPEWVTANDDAAASAAWAAERAKAEAGPQRDGRAAAIQRIVSDKSGNAAVASLTASDPFAQRAAAETLSGTPNVEAIRPLFHAWAAAPLADTELVHALRVALRRNLLDPAGFQAAVDLAVEVPMFNGRLQEIALAADTVPAAEFLVGHLQEKRIADRQLGSAFAHAARYLPPTSAGAMQKALEVYAGAPLEQRLAISEGLGEATRRMNATLPEETVRWMNSTLLEGLSASEKHVLARTLSIARNVSFPEKVGPLAKIVKNGERSDATRIAALEALTNTPAGKPVIVIALQQTSSPALQKRAAELLAETGGDEAHAALAAALPTAPWELALALAGGLARNDQASEQLLGLLESGKASPALLRNQAVAGRLAGRAQPLRDRAGKLTANLPPEDARLDQVIKQRIGVLGKRQADLAKGQQLFQQQCAACHKVKDLGGNIAPSLDGVATRGLHRLVEDILDPNRNVDPAFRQSVIETVDGRTLAGVNLRTEGEMLVFSNVEGKTVSVPKAEVKTQTDSRLSLMPAVFEQTLSEGDFGDLIAFLTAGSH